MDFLFRLCLIKILNLLQIFWEVYKTALGIELNFSSAFHLQADGQSERTV